MAYTGHKNRRARRSGTTTVELAFVLPVFLVFIFGLIEYGRAQMVDNMIQNACRVAARIGATDGMTTAAVEQRVRDLMQPAVGDANITVIVRDAGIYDTAGSGDLPENQADYEDLPAIELVTTPPRHLFLVRAQIEYDEISLIPLPLMRNITLTGLSFMRHE